MLSGVRQPDNLQHDARTQGENAGAHEEKVVGAELLDRDCGDGRPQRPAKAGTAADQAKEPLGLPGVVHVVGECPELADQQNTENLSKEVERDGDPDGPGAEQNPEDQEKHHENRLRDRNHESTGESPDRAAVQVHLDADED